MCVLFILNYKHVTGLSMMHPGRNPSGRWGAKVLGQRGGERTNACNHLLHMPVWSKIYGFVLDEFVRRFSGPAAAGHRGALSRLQTLSLVLHVRPRWRLRFRFSCCRVEATPAATKAWLLALAARVSPAARGRVSVSRPVRPIRSSRSAVTPIRAVGRSADRAAAKASSAALLVPVLEPPDGHSGF